MVAAAVAVRTVCRRISLSGAELDGASYPSLVQNVYAPSLGDLYGG